jgi:hypothetical protein
MLEDMRGLLQAADEKRQASIAELSAKHQKVNLHSGGSDVIPYFNIKTFMFLYCYMLCKILCFSFRTVSVFFRTWRVWKLNLLMRCLIEAKQLKQFLHYR